MRGLTQPDADAVLRDYPDASKAEAAARMRLDIEGGKVRTVKPDYDAMFGRQKTTMKGKARAKK